MSKAKALTNAIRKHPLQKTGQLVIRDSTPGFLVIIGKRRRTFYFQCETVHLGKRAAIKRAIGPVEKWDINDARIEALRQIKAVKDGVSEKREITLWDAWQHYRERLERRIANGQQSDLTLTSYAHKMERLFADWHDVSLRELSDNPMMVAERHRQISEANGRVTANMAVRVLRGVP